MSETVHVAVTCGCNARVSWTISNPVSEQGAKAYIADEIDKFWLVHQHSPCPDPEQDEGQDEDVEVFDGDVREDDPFEDEPLSEDGGDGGLSITLPQM